MKSLRFVVMVLALLALALSLASCGGGATGISSLDPALTSNSFPGISVGDFKAVRYNDAGYKDSALNPTLDLHSVVNGDLTTVSVAINDTEANYGVTLEVLYDAAKYTPVTTSFSGLIDTALELAGTRTAGIVSLGQVDVNGRARRSGDFATLTFRAGPARNVLAFGDSHTVLVNETYAPPQLTVAGANGFTVTKSTAESGNPASYSILATFAIGDGNDDGGTNIASLTPIIAYGNYQGFISDTNFAVAMTDYDGNGQCNISDLTPIGLHLNELTTGIEVVLSDSAVIAAGAPALTTLAWGDGAAAVIPPVTTTDWSDIYRQWDGTVTDAQLLAADTNTDGTVFISARTSNGTTAQAAFDGLPLTSVIINNKFIITGIDVQMVGATGGTGATVEDFIDGDTASLVANSSLTLNVTGMSGTYEATSFTAANHIAQGVPAAEYDDTLAQIVAMTDWEAVIAGDADMYFTSDVLVPGSSTGTGIAVTVFPDEDPESTGATPEGALTVTVPQTGTSVPSAIVVNVGLDVTADPNAPTYQEMFSSAGTDGPNFKVSVNATTDIGMGFNFGGPVPGDLTTITAELWDFGVDPSHGPGSKKVDLTYNADATLSPGEFEIRLNNPPVIAGDYVLTARIGGGVVGYDHTYAIRMSVPPYSSVNYPGGAVLTVGEAPPAVAFVVLPPNGDIFPDNDYLWVFYPDPVLRRDGRVTFNPLTSSVDPNDQVGFDDVIKTAGSEFPITYRTESPNTGLTPRITIVEGADPSTIGAATAGQAGILPVALYPGHLVFDIAVITTPGNMGDPDVNYGFKVFDASDNTLGDGTLVVAKTNPIAPPGPVGIDWGVNAFSSGSRGDLTLAARDYSNQVVDGSTVGGPAPDVIFFEFGGGQVSDYDGDIALANNVVMHLIDTTTAGSMDFYFAPAIIGLTAAGNVIGAHAVVPADFINPTLPGGGTGRLDPGHQFELQIDDLTIPGVDVTFSPKDLTVIGTNPNNP